MPRLNAAEKRAADLVACPQARAREHQARIDETIDAFGGTADAAVTMVRMAEELLQYRRVMRNAIGFVGAIQSEEPFVIMGAGPHWKPPETRRWWFHPATAATRRKPTTDQRRSVPLSDLNALRSRLGEWRLSSRRIVGDIAPTEDEVRLGGRDLLAANRCPGSAQRTRVSNRILRRLGGLARVLYAFSGGLGDGL